MGELTSGGTPNRYGRFLAYLWILPISVFGYFSFVAPWPEAEQALLHLGPGPRLVISLSYQRPLFNSASPAVHRSQTYLALPRSLLTLTAYEVIQDGERIRVSDIRFGLLIFAAIYGVWIGVSVWHLLGGGMRLTPAEVETQRPVRGRR